MIKCFKRRCPTSPAMERQALPHSGQEKTASCISGRGEQACGRGYCAGAGRIHALRRTCHRGERAQEIHLLMVPRVGSGNWKCSEVQSKPMSCKKACRRGES
eukprot:4007988-Prorocentrum_lima.AAC.1